MAEVLASLKKIGGSGEQYTETVLWTNPSPTANFSPQDVTLSQSIDNFKYIKFTYKAVSTVDTVSSEIISTADLNATTNVHNNYALGLCGFGNVSGSLKPWCRIVYHVNSTTIHFNPARTINEANTNDGRLIPLEIIGVNELAHNGTVRSAFCISGTSAGTTYGHGGSSSDTTLMDVDSGGTNTQAKSYTVKRDAKGKVGFSFCNRGTVTRYPTVKLNGTDIYSGRLDDWIISALPLIDVTLSANDVIELSCGQSTSQLISMYFIEE